MSCGSRSGDTIQDTFAAQAGEARDEEMRLASRSLGGGLRQTDVSVPDIRCGGCMRTIENALGALAGVEHARVNLST